MLCQSTNSWLLVLLLVAGAQAGCNGEETVRDASGDGSVEVSDLTDHAPTDSTSDHGDGPARASLAGWSLVLEHEDSTTRIWEFDADGTTAHLVLMGGGVTATYVYDVTAPTLSVLTLDVEGSADQLALTWTTETTGTYVEVLDGSGRGVGTFRLEPVP